MAEIDSLTIRINAETGAAVTQLKQITQLVEKLNTAANDKGWKSFTSGISALGKAATHVEGLSTALGNLQKMQVTPQLKDNFDKITASTASLPGASKNISQFNRSITRLIKIGEESDRMSRSFQRVTGLLSKMSHTLGQTKFAEIANGLKSFSLAMSRIKKLGESQDLSSNFTTVAQAVAKFSNQLNNAVSDETLARLERIASALSAIANAAGATTRTVARLQNIRTPGAERAKTFAQAWQNTIRVIETVNRVISDLGRDLYNAFDSTGIMSDLSRMSGAITKNIPILGELTEAWKSAASQIRTIVLSNASVVDKAANIILVRVSTIIRTLYSLAKLPVSSVALGSTKGIISLISAPLKNLANTVTDLTKRWRKFTSSLARIAIYRLIRSALKEISKAMKEGIQNLYLWGQAWQNTYSSAARFVETMDRLATAFLYLKNSVGAMVSPLLDAVAPVIDMLIDKFVALTNAINQAMAALSGASVWRKALKYQYTYAEAADLSNKKAKKLKRTVLSFDELNKLDDPSKGSGSKKKDDLDYSKMFEEVPVESWVNEILNSTSWRILGTGVANKINQALASINWNSVQSKARIWARRFGSMFDGVLMGVSMPLIGKSLADGLNTIAFSINTFFKEFHFRNLGQNLADGFTSMINTMNWGEIGEALTQKWKALFELAIGFKDVDLTGLGTGIVELFRRGIENIPISEFVDAIKTLMPKIGTELGLALGGIIKTTNETIGGIDAEGLGSSFSLAIDNMLKGIDPKEAGIFLSNGIRKIIEFASGALKTLPFEELKSWVSTMITSAFTNIDLNKGVQGAIDIATKIVELLTTIVKAVPWEDVGEAVENSDTSELKSGIMGLFESAVDGLERAGFMDEIATGLATFFGLKLGGAISRVVPSIIAGTIARGGATAGTGAGAAAGGGLLGSILGTLGIGAGGATAGAVLGQQISHNIIGPILEGFGSADADLYKNWTFFGENGLFQASMDFAKFKAEDFENYLHDFGATHRAVFDDLKDGTSVFSDAFGLLHGVVTGDTEEMNTSVNGLKETFTLWTDAWSTEHPLISDGFDSIYDTIKNSKIGSAWDDIMSGLHTETNTVLKSIEDRFGAAFNFLTGGIKDLLNGANDLNNLGKGINTNPGKITARASGGFVDKGDLFLAGEAGPEIVTSYGGDTAVMNMEQIISSISASVAAASGGDITIPVVLDGGILDRVIVTAQQRQNVRSGR